MDHIPRLSEVLYVGLCRKIGTPTEVAIRRDVLDMKEMISRPVDNYEGIAAMNSGSYREGFRFKSSDIDTMYWFCRFKLITDISQSRIYNTSKHVILQMEDFDTLPGFVRLRLLTSPQNIFTISMCLAEFNGGVYMSGSLWREFYFQFLANDRYFQQKNIRNHGPCVTGVDGTLEFDQAACFASIYWPKQTRDWFDRCQRHTWPPVLVLEKILRNGFHCVPIGSKIVSTSNELEWRLSFSQAEQQLVSTMNHTQFLCYGLLKIFLKEVINYRKEPLLCSYFMKTTMFWMIQLGHLIWLPNRLLDCFWKCFKYLIYCVYEGDFPNFFIPQNNMFINKMVADTRASLLQQLYQYYRMGVTCLLLSPTLKSILEPALSSPSFVLSTAEGEFISIADIDLCGMTEIFQIVIYCKHMVDIYLYLKSNDILSSFSCSPYQLLTLQYVKSDILVQLAFTVANNNSSCKYKNVYILDRVICNVLKLAGRLGPIYSLLFLALYYYRTAKYEKALHIIYLSKQRLSEDNTIYFNTVDRHRYIETVGNLPLSKRMNKAWVENIILNNNILYIEELCLEQYWSLQNGTPFLILSPNVMIELLSVLSHYRLGNRSQCLQSLTDLQTLLLCDDNVYALLETRDIAWQILGICQHIVGDLHGALQSYEVSLRQYQYNKIQEATLIRIECVKEQQHRIMQA
ncbi:uncharacterized protein LOC134278617 [Saccostrea cucullata]|uniref:uncharacterized protein LOC134278617 n=1 Tax=Saccostrea cuccullata TaxID=36930 RepID=UPI002ED025FE